jgi:hypothetical protein
MHAGQTPPSYPHLDARLQQLTGDALHFWGDSAVRRRSLEVVLDAYTQGDSPRLEAALRAVDQAIVDGLRALTFDRDSIKALRLRSLGVLGQKSPLCYLDLDADELRLALTVSHNPDTVVETWIHESVHARKRPWSVEYRTELEQWIGYEEGLAEMLSRQVSRLGALGSQLQPYERYHSAYESLAETLRVTPEELVRRFWAYEPGTVRQAITDVVDDLYHLSRGRHLSLQERLDVQTEADTIFDSAMEHLFSRAIERYMRRRWQTNLP